MKAILTHLRKKIINGLLAIVPLFLVYIVLHFLYNTIDQGVLKLIDGYVGFRTPGLGILIVLVVLYLMGLLSGNLFGKWLFNLTERLTRRIPIIGTTYQVGKQISHTLSLPEKQVFQKVVLLNYLTNDMYTIGFVTGSLLVKKSDEKLYKIFIPTPPNPTSGTLVIAREFETIDPGWTVDEGIRAVISAGIIGPEDISLD